AWVPWLQPESRATDSRRVVVAASVGIATENDATSIRICGYGLHGIENLARGGSEVRVLELLNGFALRVQQHKFLRPFVVGRCLVVVARQDPTPNRVKSPATPAARFREHRCATRAIKNIPSAIRVNVRR